MTQGRQANRNGRAAEDVLSAILDRKACAYRRQYPIGLGIFETPLFVDFYLPTTKPFPNGLIIESKWQQVAGSAEEKLCYLVENIRTVYPCTTIVMIDGSGFRPGAIHWLKAQAGQGRLFAAFDLREFLTWSNQSL
jgi:hypothetical protein